MKVGLGVGRGVGWWCGAQALGPGIRLMIDANHA
jgi:hypothetical protein